MASSYHHVGLQVADLERSIPFYVDVLGGRVQSLPIVFDGESAAIAMDGPAGTKMRYCQVGFDPGVVELFQFVGDAVPGWARDRPAARLPHFGLQVDDVLETVERVEAAGGRRLWPNVMPWGEALSMYIADPDGNVIELIDVSAEQVLATLLADNPEATPAAG